MDFPTYCIQLFLTVSQHIYLKRGNLHLAPLVSQVFYKEFTFYKQKISHVILLFPLEVEHHCKVSFLHGHFVPEQQSFRINDKAKYICQNGYTTSKGETEVETQCHTEGWNPEPECISK